MDLNEILTQVLTCLSHVNPVYAAVAFVVLYFFRDKLKLNLPTIPLINPAPTEPKIEDPLGPVLDWLKQRLHLRVNELVDEGASHEDAVLHIAELLRKPKQ